VGSAAQTKPMKKVAGSIKLALAQYRDLEAFSQFSSDLDPETKKQLDRGERLTEMLKQKQFHPLKAEEQVAVIYAVDNGYLDEVELENLGTAQDKLVEYMNSVEPELMEKISEGDWSDETQEELKQAVIDFTEKTDLENLSD
jgi:F0F1-type ATP synthase alpha subunit